MQVTASAAVSKSLYRSFIAAVHTAPTDLPMRFCCVGSDSSTAVDGAMLVVVAVAETPLVTTRV